MPTWTLKTRFKLDAAHFIEGYDGKCGRMHGHTYTVEMHAKSHKLNPSKWLKTPDMVCDFNELKWVAKDVSKGGFDHGIINELMPGVTTAERIAEYLHKETVARIPEGIDLRVIVWETDTSCVEYTDKDE